MFSFILEKSLHSRLLVLMASVVLMGAGLYSLSQTTVDVFPDLNRTTVTLMTEAGGMAAEEVEQLVSLPLETGMAGLPGMEAVRSVSTAGLSIVYLTFDWKSEVYAARQMVSERLGAIDNTLPQGLSPRLGPLASIMGEIMLIAIPYEAIEGAGAETGRPVAMATREYADWVMRPRLMAIPGMAQVIAIGGEVRQFQVQPSTVRMAELGISQKQLEEALTGFASNTSGGFLALNGREYLIRHLGRTANLDDLKSLALTARNGQSILLRQIAEVTFAPAIRRGAAGLSGQPAVVLSLQKQPGADTIKLSGQVDAALVELARAQPAGISAPRITFRQASFIEASIATLKGKLLAASVVVALVLYLFVGSLRTTLIALVAIPVSVLTAVLVFNYFGMSINTMTLGGLAIAIGGLVDDAIVDVENILRRLREDRQRSAGRGVSEGGVAQDLLALIKAASLEVRSSIVYATVIVVLVFVPLFALPGMEGRLFAPLGVAFIVAMLASLLVSVTITPVLAYYLLPHMPQLDHGDTRLLVWLKLRYRHLLARALQHGKRLMFLCAGLAVLAIISVPFFARTFLPPFNEGTLLVGLRLNPGVTLDESVRIAAEAERLVAQVPEVVHVGRRSGRAEQDEHAEGVHVSELDVGLKPYAELSRSMEEIIQDVRTRLANLPTAISIGQPIAHRIDHMMSGVRAPLVLKLYGDDLDVLRSQAAQLHERLRGVSGLADLEIEKQVLAPQLKVRIDYAAAAQYGVPVPQIMASLQALVEGETVAQIVEGNRRFGLVLRLPESARTPQGLASLLLDTPSGRIPLSRVATLEDSDGPNQISRDNGRRRIVISANTAGRALSDVVADVRRVLAETPLPAGYFVSLEGQFKAQEESARLIGALSLVALLLMFAVLHQRYQSTLLALLVMANIPLALVGSVVGLYLSGQPLSIAAMVGFITLAGISVRNGILMLSHYINLMRFEQEPFGLPLIVRGSLERLAPVLMTALVTAFALAPLLFEAEAPGTEILHPVAVVIFSGLLVSTLLDTLLTPVLFQYFGRAAAERLCADKHAHFQGEAL